MENANGLAPRQNPQHEGGEEEISAFRGQPMEFNRGGQLMALESWIVGQMAREAGGIVRSFPAPSPKNGPLDKWAYYEEPFFTLARRMNLPTVNQRHTIAFKQNRMMVNKGWKQAKALISMLATKKMEFQPTTDRVLVNLDITMHSRADIDNRIKIVLDALTGIVYKDDSQIDQLNVRKHRTAKKEDEGFTISVHLMAKE